MKKKGLFHKANPVELRQKLHRAGKKIADYAEVKKGF